MSKKLKKTLTFDEKFEIIQLYQDNKKLTYVRLSEIFSQRFNTNLTDRTVKNIIDSKAQTIENISLGLGKMTKNRPVKYKILEDTLKKWIFDIESKKGFLTDSLILLKANEIIKKEKIEDLKLSSGWVNKFKIRNNLSIKVLHGESGAVE